MTALRAAVLGAGSWGTTFAAVLADAGCSVTVWGRDEAVCRQIADDHRNEAYLPGIALPAGVTASSDSAPWSSPMQTSSRSRSRPSPHARC